MFSENDRWAGHTQIMHVLEKVGKCDSPIFCNSNKRDCQYFVHNVPENVLKNSERSRREKYTRVYSYEKEFGYFSGNMGRNSCFCNNGENEYGCVENNESPMEYNINCNQFNNTDTNINLETDSNNKRVKNISEMGVLHHNNFHRLQSNIGEIFNCNQELTNNVESSKNYSSDCLQSCPSSILICNDNSNEDTLPCETKANTKNVRYKQHKTMVNTDIPENADVNVLNNNQFPNTETDLSFRKSIKVEDNSVDAANPNSLPEQTYYSDSDHSGSSEDDLKSRCIGPGCFEDGIPRYNGLCHKCFNILNNRFERFHSTPDVYPICKGPACTSMGKRSLKGLCVTCYRILNAANSEDQAAASQPAVTTPTQVTGQFRSNPEVPWDTYYKTRLPDKRKLKSEQSLYREVRNSSGASNLELRQSHTRQESLSEIRKHQMNKVIVHQHQEMVSRGLENVREQMQQLNISEQVGQISRHHESPTQHRHREEMHDRGLESVQEVSRTENVGQARHSRGEQFVETGNQGTMKRSSLFESNIGQGDEDPQVITRPHTHSSDEHRPISQPSDAMSESLVPISIITQPSDSFTESVSLNRGEHHEPVSLETHPVHELSEPGSSTIVAQPSDSSEERPYQPIVEQNSQLFPLPQSSDYTFGNRNVALLHSLYAQSTPAENLSLHENSDTEIDYAYIG